MKNMCQSTSCGAAFGTIHCAGAHDRIEFIVCKRSEPRSDNHWSVTHTPSEKAYHS
jgi:hypothetical protein